MNISNINPINVGLSKDLETSVENSQSDQGFAAYLKKSFSDVNLVLNSADKLTTDMAVGKSENLHEAMIGMEKAETAFKLLVQVRNRALEAYHEVMRMQV